MSPQVADLLSSERGEQLLAGHRAFEDVVDAAPVGQVELKGFGRPIAADEIRSLRR